MESVIVLSARDHARLKKQDLGTLEPEQRYMTEFILEEECRRKISTKYFDGITQTCEESESIRCDHCQRRYDQMEQSRHKRPIEESMLDENIKRARYKERVKAQQKTRQMNAELYVRVRLGFVGVKGNNRGELTGLWSGISPNGVGKNRLCNDSVRDALPTI